MTGCSRSNGGEELVALSRSSLFSLYLSSCCSSRRALLWSRTIGNYMVASARGVESLLRAFVFTFTFNCAFVALPTPHKTTIPKVYAQERPSIAVKVLRGKPRDLKE